MIRRKDGWTPKTAHSDRDIPIGASLMADLVQGTKEARKEALKKGWPASSLVFPGRQGVKMTDFDKALATAIKRANVFRDGKPLHLTPHMLRKGHATWQKMRGIDDSLLQPRLGHAPGSRVTAHNYVHMPTEALRGTALDLQTARSKR
jgi:integrase